MASYVQTLMDPITSGPNSPQGVKSSRDYAAELMKDSRRPIQHWAQGVDNLTRALLGGHTEFKANEQEESGRKRSMEMLLQALGVNPSSNPAGPMAAPASAPLGPTPNTTFAEPPSPDNPLSGVAGFNTSPNPAPAPQQWAPQDRDRVIRTIYGEAGNQGPDGQAAVAAVIANRLKAGTFGKSPTEVVMAPNQFEPWGNPAARQRMEQLRPDSPEYQAIAAQLDRVLKGEDPTQGATHFYAPKAQAALNRAPPRWDNGKGFDIGDHRFFRLNNGPGANQQPNMQVASAPSTSRTDAIVDSLLGPQQPMQSPELPPSPMAQGPMGAGVTPTGSFSPLSPNGPQQGIAPPAGPSAANMPASAGVVPPSSPAATPPTMNRQMLAQVLMDPWAPDGAKAAVMQQLLPKDPQIVKLGKGETANVWDPRSQTFKPVAGANQNTPDFEDTTKLRREVADLPEVKRYSQAAPIFQSMIKSAKNNTAASDLDFVYGIAKIFDPESVVREGEMKLVGAAQSIPQQLQGYMAQAVNGQGRLTPEMRQQLLDVSATRMMELRGAFDERLKPYEGIVTRNRLNRADVFPGFGDLPEVPRLSQTPPPAGPQGANQPAPNPAITQQYPNAKQAPDGFYYVPDPQRPGKYLKVNP